MFSDELLATAVAVLELCRAKGLRLATAESCTGGLIAGCLTEIPGASRVVDRSFVTYSDQAKKDMLGLSDELLRVEGAVSAEAARTMAMGALARSDADIAVSCTGIAGPAGATESKRVGLIHIAAARKGGPILHQRHDFGDIGRAEVRRKSVAAALKLVILLLTEHADPPSERQPNPAPPRPPSLQIDGGAPARPDATGTQEVSIRGKDVLLVVLAMMGLFAFFTVIGVIFLSVARDAKPGGGEPALAATFLVYTLILAAMSGSVYLVMVRLRGLSWSDIGFVPVPELWTLLAIMTGLALVPAVTLAQWVLGASLDDSYIRLIAPHGFSWAALIGTLTFLGVLTPIAEEVLFRSLIYRWMRGRWGVAVAVAASSVLFGVMHFDYALVYVPITAGIGVVLALAFERTASLWPPIAIHVTFNSAGILLVYGSLPQ